MKISSALKKLVKGIFHLPKSFYYSFEGVAFCVRYEKSLRIHLILTAYALFFALKFYNFSKVEYLIILFACALEISMELMNTAIECVVDKVSPEKNVLAKAAKDVAAGAVFIASIFEILVVLILYFNTEKLKIIAKYFSNPFHLSILIVTLIISTFFIFIGHSRKELSNKKYLEKLKRDEQKMADFIARRNKFFGIETIEEEKKDESEESSNEY